VSTWCAGCDPKDNITPAEVKQRVGNLRHAYMRWKNQQGRTDGPKTCEARRRCWTLAYPDRGFHLDVLPTIPELEHSPTGILLTDKQLYRWQHSNRSQRTATASASYASITDRNHSTLLSIGVDVSAMWTSGRADV
jgi:hypothetical protein